MGLTLGRGLLYCVMYGIFITTGGKVCDKVLYVLVGMGYDLVFWVQLV